MTRQRITEGSILEININDKYYCYAQILKNANYAFFNYKSEKKLKDFSCLTKAPILFVVAVYKSIITKGRWIKVGKMTIREELKVLPMKFIQDSLDPQRFKIYDPNTGEIKKSTRNECVGLECAAVWEAEHVEDRIADFYEDKPNKWVEQLSIK